MTTKLQAQRYDFDHFTFVSRRIADTKPIGPVIGPINSIYSEKNYNSGRLVSEETMRQVRQRGFGHVAA